MLLVTLPVEHLLVPFNGGVLVVLLLLLLVLGLDNPALVSQSCII